MALSITFIAMYPVTAEVTTPNKSGKMLIDSPALITFAPDISVAPKITGILIKNAKLALSFLLIFAKQPAEITVPLRDSPGNIATLCAKPIASELFTLNGKLLLLFLLIVWAKNSSVAVNKKVIDNKIADNTVP